MKIVGKVFVVTGGASGIGRALAERFARDGARGVVVADLDEGGARRVAESISGIALRTDVAVEADVKALVARAVEAYGKVRGKAVMLTREKVAMLRHHWVCESQKTQDDLGWKPVVDMEQSLRTIFESYRSKVTEARSLTTESA